MSETTNFDCIIIGGGLAGMQLALAFCEDSFFVEKRIAIIEPLAKNTNDKTWCFWEKGEGKWDELLQHSWTKANFFGPNKNLKMDFGGYSYKMLPSLNFYKYAKAKIDRNKNITWISEEVTNVQNQTINTSSNQFQSNWIFDSRVYEGFNENKHSTTVLQPFKGWVIETETDAFDASSFTFMDYRLTHKQTTCFTYVLPISKRKALVEFTFFVPELIDDSIYDLKLKQYITEYLKIKSYSVTEVEQGVIPMSSFPFWKVNTNNYQKIGTAGGWVKASTGYSFKNTEKKVEQLVAALKNGKNTEPSFWQKRFRFYDEVLLNILHGKNEKGPEVFERMYAKNEAHEIFKFLDEETTFAEELKIMWNTDRPLFIKSVLELLKR